jgi:hypothetical protein
MADRKHYTQHVRGYAGRGPDDGGDRGAFCEACSWEAQDYVWPCLLEQKTEDMRANMMGADIEQEGFGEW